MSWYRWAIFGMSALIFGATLNEALFGDRIGLVVAGAAISIGGVFLACIVLEPKKVGSDES